MEERAVLETLPHSTQLSPQRGMPLGGETEAHQLGPGPHHAPQPGSSQPQPQDPGAHGHPLTPSLSPGPSTLSPGMANVSVSDAFSCYDPTIVGYRYVAVAWGSVVSVVGTVGNILTLLALVSEPGLRTGLNVLVANLALADLLYCTGLQPFSVDSYLWLHWRGGATACQAFGLLLFVANATSVLTLCLVAISRYLLIAGSPRSARLFARRRVALAAAGATWAVALVSFAPLWPVYGFVPKVCTCSFHRERSRPYSTVLLGLYFIVGLGCVGAFYFLIYRRVRATAQALRRYQRSLRGGQAGVPGQYHEMESGTDTGITQSSSDAATGHSAVQQSCAVAPPPRPREPGAGGGKEAAGVTRMCFAVFAVFVLSYAPFLAVTAGDARAVAPTGLHMAAAQLTWLNSCINPLLYAVMNRRFRHAYRTLLQAGPRRLCGLWGA
ncbi:G-protein coupled receptor 84 isoform X1 [Alligator sinensis]|uniref:G-protein coupled receptor 84 isoform X1 n=1 Tax=Alligator sinensis TaxID=38654 RepID=A0A3Q0FJ50_ALLSI|nr:G-protein coupled receptor 84 isoform X1 [Alligator sinensis]